MAFRAYSADCGHFTANLGCLVIVALSETCPDTESDEISLLFEQDERLFGRKLRKYNSTLAGEASATFSLLLGKRATFDCRISQLPNSSLVVDYFRWRSEDAGRNSAIIP